MRAKASAIWLRFEFSTQTKRMRLGFAMNGADESISNSGPGGPRGNTLRHALSDTPRPRSARPLMAQSNKSKEGPAASRPEPAPAIAPDSSKRLRLDRQTGLQVQSQIRRRFRL